jgi:hypothetical protein
MSARGTAATWVAVRVDVKVVLWVAVLVGASAAGWVATSVCAMAAMMACGSVARSVAAWGFLSVGWRVQSFCRPRRGLEVKKGH